MNYYFSKTVDDPMDAAIAKLAQELKKEEFGILTEIDMAATLAQKLNVRINNYRILGACNPHFAYEALQQENKIGLMLPCNIVVQQREDGRTEISAVDPVASMMAIPNESLANIAGQVREKLRSVIENC
ncbi:MAG TPA: DUF302 domain-containing protein [Flavitalea sp.]|nr:DUF302 domain-containing protein [Flavitalea sp.]